MRKITISILLVVIIFSVGGFFIFNQNKAGKLEEKSNTSDAIVVSEEKTIEGDNGDLIYIPSSDAINVDEEAEIIYYDNLLNVYLRDEVSEREADEIAESIHGTIVGKMEGVINLLQVQVEEGTYNELNDLATQLNNHESVAFSLPSVPSFISNAESGNTDNQADGSWWEEAIGINEVWEYVDENEGDFEAINVGVLESGRLGEGDHEVFDADIAKSVTADNREGKPFWIEQDDDCEERECIDSHARWVTKFIVADPDENSHNFRGVAANVAKVNFTSIGLYRERLTEEEEINGVTEPFIYHVLNTNIEQGVKILNNSWGFPPDSEKKWQNSGWINKFLNFMSYNKYLKSEKKTNDQLSAQLITYLDRLISFGLEDFLIVQSAGNGKVPYRDQENNESWTEVLATDAINTGGFANINDETYAQALKLNENLNLELSELLDHIIVVGGVELKENDMYEAPAWASYGEAIDIVAPAANLSGVSDLAHKQNEQTSINGTSFATPMVSGAAALLWSHNPALTAKEVKNFLINSSKRNIVETVEGQTYSYPMLNAAGFLEGYEIYDELIETYKQAIEEQWGAEKLLEEDIYPFDDYSLDRRLPETLGYEFRDINHDGTLEMIVGDYWEDGSPEIYDIYKLIDGELEKVFTNGIRTKVNIYKDGTVSDTYGDRYLGYYHLKSNGEKNVIDGYELNNAREFVSLKDSDQRMSETAKKDLVSQYNNIKITKHTFKPFVIKKQTKKEKTELTDDAMKKIMHDTYNSLEDILLEDSIDDIFNEHHTIEEAQEIYESGIDPNSPLYEDLYDLLYPKVKHLVAKEGMKSFINIKFALYWNPVGNVTFYSPGYDLEVIDQRNNQFILKQTKEIPTQDAEVTTESTYDIYHVKFIKEKDKWKFAGAKEKR